MRKVAPLVYVVAWDAFNRVSGMYPLWHSYARQESLLTTSRLLSRVVYPTVQAWNWTMYKIRNWRDR